MFSFYFYDYPEPQDDPKDDSYFYHSKDGNYYYDLYNENDRYYKRSDGYYCDRYRECYDDKGGYMFSVDYSPAAYEC